MVKKVYLADILVPPRPVITENMRIMAGTVEFRDYVRTFYGPRGIYDMGAKEEHIAQATILYVKFLAANGAEFLGDSLDRERVRDIMIEKFKLVFPEAQRA